MPTPSIEELVDSGNLQKFIDTTKPLRLGVPGCGRGYDVVYFASKFPKWTCFGIDLAEQALEDARKQNTCQNATFILDNVLEPSGNWADSKFDILFDYTFLCALPLNIRPKWADSMAKYCSPGGLLICLEHPLDKLSDDGPPFRLSSEIYKQLLQDKFERVYFEKPTRIHHNGQSDMLSIWKRKND